MIFSSVGRVIDALLAIPGADALGSGAYLATATMPAVTVSDGPWLEAVIPQELVTVGISATDVQSQQGNSGSQSVRNIGGPLRMNEGYDVLSAIRVWDGDPNAQKKVRDRALALFSVFEFALRSNPSLGGAIQQAATIAAVDLVQDDPDITDGCICWLSFTVNVRNLLT